MVFVIGWNKEMHRFDSVDVTSSAGELGIILDAAQIDERTVDLFIVRELGHYSIWRLEIAPSRTSATLTRYFGTLRSLKKTVSSCTTSTLFPSFFIGR